MTTGKATNAAPEPDPFIFLPEPPEERRDGMVYYHLGKNGNGHHLFVHLSERRSTLMGSSAYISPVVSGDTTGLFDPDLFVSFDADEEGYSKRNGYIISEQGKPPDFVLEIASYRTGDLDTTVMRDAYESLGITEYWRFDPTGEYNGAFLAADRLVNGRYQPITTAQLTDRIWQGYSAVLDLYIRWESGQLRWYDPATGRHIRTFEDERARADQAREARLQAEAALDAALERIRQLEAEQSQRD